jgi:DNA-binding beta-propeller fold protein YncE
MSRQHVVLAALAAALGFLSSADLAAQSFELQQRGRYVGGATGASEIVAYDATTRRMFVTNGATNSIDVIDVADVDAPALAFNIDLTPYGGGVNSVAVKNGLLAAAVQGATVTTPGVVVVFDTTGALKRIFPAGALPDHVSFSPNGNFLLAANEGEPLGMVNPPGSVTLIDLAPGIDKATATTIDFSAFDGREAELRSRGVRLFPGVAPSRDLEPEYIAVAPANDLAFVTLQEANAFAVIDLATRTIRDIVPAGLKNHGRGLPRVQTYDFPELPALGTTPAGQTIRLGGFSGLWLENVDAGTGVYNFVAVPDRGPNGEPTNVDADAALERPFALPNYQPRVIRFSFDPATGAIALTGTVLLTRPVVIPAPGAEAPQGGPMTVALTGLPNIALIDEEPVNLFGQPILPLDPFGADLEGVVVAPDGSYWMVDEYRPAIYHFSPTGVLINRFVPIGTGALGGQAAGFYGAETLPAAYSLRRQNRGFEAMAADFANNILYAFIQTPLANPNRAASDASQVIRMVGIDMTSGATVAEYVYLYEKAAFREQLTDKIGDAVYAGNGRFFIVERDDSVLRSGKKMLFEFTLTGATNLRAAGAPPLLAGQTLEQHTPDELVTAGIRAIEKVKVANLPSLGYYQGDKLEGLALLPNGGLAVLNDNDFGIAPLPLPNPPDGSVPLDPEPTPIQLGIVSFDIDSGLDPSDRDGPSNGGLVNILNWPVYGMHMPDTIASFSANGSTYYASAGEGDDRGEVARIGAASFVLNPTVFPNATALKTNAQLGRLNASTIDGKLAGAADPDFDRLQVLGSRSFIVWDRWGNLVFDSGDQLEQITAAFAPANFNADNAANNFDDRSDNKGPEPEAIAVGSTPEGRTYAFVGLERFSGIATFDVTDPNNVSFAGYTNNRDFSATIDLATAPAAAGDLGPEGIVFIPAADSPTGEPMIAVSNEISGTTTLYSIREALFKDSFE